MQEGGTYIGAPGSVVVITVSQLTQRTVDIFGHSIWQIDPQHKPKWVGMSALPFGVLTLLQQRQGLRPRGRGACAAGCPHFERRESYEPT